MVTDILAKGTELYVAGDRRPLERAFGGAADDGVIDLPGRHEPQEAGRAEAAGGGRALSRGYSGMWNVNIRSASIRA